MRTLFLSLVAVSFSLVSSISIAQTSYQNSPYNMQNSPYNMQNSPYNSSSNRGVYDDQGNRSGYAVPRQDGSGVNIFDNEGNRTGYIPRRR